MTSSPLAEHISRRITLNQKEILEISKRGKREVFKKGDFISKEGEIAKYSSYVISGCIKTFHTDADGNEHVVSFAIEDWWCGDLASFISGEPADYSIKCLENSEVIHLDTNDYEELFKKVPKFESFFRELIQNAYINAQKRIVNNFSLNAKERYTRFREKYPSFERRIPQYLIASYLGITKEFLSKIRKELLYES